MHGRSWTNRVGEVLNWPYGHDEKRPVDMTFVVVDGSQKQLTLHDFIQLGGVRSTHVGQWNRPYAIVPAACGVRVLLHEFKEQNTEIRTFLNTELTSRRPEIWGPYCEWAPDAQKKLAKIGGEFGTIAQQSRSPFTFHVHATRLRFPNCTLASSFFLNHFGEEKLYTLFSAIARHEPERFYRLINSQGLTHRLVRVANESLVFDDGEIFWIPRAAENLIRTFKELSALETDLDHSISPTHRLVLDSHVYVVLLALAELHGESPRFVAHHLSGSGMYEYLVKGKDAEAHKKRNDRLFRFLADELSTEGVPTLNGKPFEFNIYPPIAYGQANQFSLDLASFSSSEWLPGMLA